MLGPAQTMKQHAYSDDQVGQVRRFFKVGDDVTDACLHRHLDEFAIAIGLQVRIEPNGRASESRDRIERELIAPVASLKRSLGAFGLRREFLVRWGVLRDFDLPAFEDQLAELERLAALHVERHRKRSRKGRGADTLLKAHHVERAYDLACYLDPRFHAQRPVKRPESRVFADFVDLLAEPIFPKGTPYVAAVRSFVVELDAACQRLARERGLPPRG